MVWCFPKCQEDFEALRHLSIIALCYSSSRANGGCNTPSSPQRDLVAAALRRYSYEGTTGGPKYGSVFQRHSANSRVL